ncbi:serine hydrolase domain-containing protein [Aliidiomarina sanyensis]|uniref:Beta-lactamase-related domain-containing protein n=1 Tax=Aliidiomarina sanyensis TaxID=1249555 RepID=A0A432WPN8_9GAMM|nr:serine hydrolase domain-containing protein [Aliidiomarina sanyensis]RUO35679.1 hypothetical protein CWE11_02665 [Aliidiomarina sanyensis]
MRAPRHLLLVLLILFCLPGCTTSPAGLSVEAQRSWLESRLAPILDDAESAGFTGAVRIVYPDGARFDSFHGVSHRQTQRAIGRDTVFHLGSVSKHWTAAAVLRAVERGDLELHQSLDKIFPDIPDSHGVITIHQLLTHQSGLADFPVPCSRVEAGDLTRTDFLNAVWASPVVASPGVSFHYSNAGYEVLAAVLEVLYEQEYEAILSEWFFSSLNLRNTGIDPSRWDNTERIAMGYRADGTEWGTLHSLFWGTQGPLWCNRGSGALLTDLDDLQQWLSALFAGEVLADDSLTRMLSPHVSENRSGESGAYYGYGWSLYQGHGFLEVAHTGSLTHVLEADVRVFPELGVLVMVLGNSEAFGATRVYPRIESVLHRWLRVQPTRQ